MLRIRFTREICMRRTKINGKETQYVVYVLQILWLRNGTKYAKINKRERGENCADKRKRRGN